MMRMMMMILSIKDGRFKSLLLSFSFQKREHLNPHLSSPEPSRYPQPTDIHYTPKERSANVAPPNLSGKSEQLLHVPDRRLFTAIENIQEEQSQQREMLQSILQLIQNIPSSSPISETRNLLDTIPFPCESQEDVEALEAELSDGVVQNNMLSYTFYKFMVLLAGSLITSLPLSN